MYESRAAHGVDLKEAETERFVLRVPPVRRGVAVEDALMFESSARSRVLFVLVALACTIEWIRVRRPRDSSGVDARTAQPQWGAYACTGESESSASIYSRNSSPSLLVVLSYTACHVTIPS